MPYDRAGDGYAEDVCEWIANPHAYFKAFGREAREFQRRHRSERLRTMTLVAPAAELAALRPTRICVDGVEVQVESWEPVFSVVTERLVAANAPTFAALQRDGLLDWLGCQANGTPIAEALSATGLHPTFESMDEVIARIQWMFLACGIRLNEVIVQADPYTDAQWHERKAEIDRKRREESAFMAGRRAAQKAWAETHSDSIA